MEKLNAEEFFYDKSFEDYYTEKDMSKAIDVLCHFLKKDEELYYAYQSNIAMAFMDAVAQDSRVKVSVAHEMANPRWVNTSERKYELSAVTLHDVSNDAARNFLNILMRDREKKK